METIEKILHLRTDEDRDACLRFLTLYRGFYSAEYLNSIIEYSDYCIYFHEQNNNKEVVAFAIIESKSKRRGEILSIQMACAIPNFAELIPQSLCNFAVKYTYPFLYVSPRTPELRKAFIKYGFESIHGIKGINELLEKEIED